MTEEEAKTFAKAIGDDLESRARRFAREVWIAIIIIILLAAAHRWLGLL